MRLRFRNLWTRFAALLAAAALLPLAAYGLVSLVSLQRGTRESVIAGNLNVATRAAEEIRRYVTQNAEILQALAADLQNTGLEPWQQDRVLKNYVLQFREFREITLFAEDGASVATSRIGRPRVAIPRGAPALTAGVTMTPMHLDREGLPTTTFAVRLSRLGQPAGWLVAEFSLEEMWRMVDQIRIGDHGYAMVVGRDGRLVAHGDPDKKALVAQERDMSSHPLVRAALAARDLAPFSREYVDGEGRRVLGVAARLAPLGWIVAVEQPTGEAYANAIRLERLLVVVISIALVAMISAGYLFSRSLIRPILELQRATHDVAEGRLERRVRIDTTDEFAALGAAFNAMAGRLAELQENVKRQERQAMFGRVISSLVHDVLQPINTLGNSARSLLGDDLDREERNTFCRIIERELATVKRFMDDLLNVARPKPIERFALDINAPVAEVVESMRSEGERHGVAVEARCAGGPLVIEGDRFALSRVFRNLITNAIQATAQGGRVEVVTARAGDQVEVTVSDTGAGIPGDRLGAIFEDFVTTKRRGLGLGLAISKRIVEQLDGTIAVASQIGRGTTFTLRFPARDDRAVQAAAS